MNYTELQFTEDKKFVKKYILLAKQNANDKELFYFYKKIVIASGAIDRINKKRDDEARAHGGRGRNEDFTSLMRNSTSLDY